MAEEWSYTFSILIRHAPDVDGVWVAHCLDNDIISTGTTPVGARELVMENISETLVDDVQRGFDFSDRPKAPEEYWSAFRSIIAHGNPGAMPAEYTPATCFAAFIDMYVAKLKIPVAAQVAETAQVETAQAGELGERISTDEWATIKPQNSFTNELGSAKGQPSYGS